MSDTNIQLVKQGFEKFFSGDIPGFIELLAPDIEWDHRGPEGVPFNRMYNGRDGVLEFFQSLDETVENTRFDVNGYYASGDGVVAIGVFAWKVKATNKAFETDFAMIYSLRDGKVSHWRPIFDRTAEVLAFQA